MNFRSLATAIALVASAPVMAQTCTNSASLGAIGPSSVAVVAHGFSAPGHFNDCFSFSLGAGSDLLGGTLTWDASWARDINLTSISLSGVGTSLVDSTPESFSFANLSSGDYWLSIAGDVTGSVGGFFGGGSVGYLGVFAAQSPAIAAPVPEPGTYAMMLAGLGVMGFVVRRRRQS